MTKRLTLLIFTIVWTTVFSAQNVNNIFPSLRTQRLVFRRRSSKSRNNNNKNVCGTKLCWRMPTPEYIRSVVFGNRMVDYNHNSVGMTHPYVSVKQNNNAQLVNNNNNNNEEESHDNKKWWPSSFGNDNNNKDDWRRICTRKENLGKGEALYRRVRDAALNWEFSSDSSMGIIAAASRDENESNCVHHDTFCRYGGGRRLATYTRKGFWNNMLLCAVNPVMVVYDLVDERCQDATYTSTAYATAQGHWLRGEERVSVILRDQTGQVDVEILSYSKPHNRIIWPFIGKMQRQFFEQQMQQLQQVANTINDDKYDTSSSSDLWPINPLYPTSQTPTVLNTSYNH